MKSRRAEHKEI